MGDTPRTDTESYWARVSEYDEGAEVVDSDFARDLEREADAAQRKANDLLSALEAAWATGHETARHWRSPSQQDAFANMLDDVEDAIAKAKGTDQ